MVVFGGGGGGGGIGAGGDKSWGLRSRLGPQATMLQASLKCSVGSWDVRLDQLGLDHPSSFLNTPYGEDITGRLKAAKTPVGYPGPCCPARISPPEAPEIVLLANVCMIST